MTGSRLVWPFVHMAVGNCLLDKDTPQGSFRGAGKLPVSSGIFPAVQKIFKLTAAAIYEPGGKRKNALPTILSTTSVSNRTAKPDAFVALARWFAAIGFC